MSTSSSHPSRVSRAIALLVLIAAAIAGAWANVYRVAYWTPVGVFEPGATSFVLPTPGAAHERLAGSHAKLTLRAPSWRPLDVSVALRVADAPAEGVDVQVSDDDARRAPPTVVVVRAGAAWQTMRIRVTAPALVDQRITLGVDADPARAGSIQIGAITAQPVMTIGARLRHGLAGAGFGLLLVLLCHPRVWRRLTSGATRLPEAAVIAVPRDPTRRLVAVGALIFLWFSLWTLVKPILQAPDEPQHVMRAESIARTPWIARDIAIDPDPRTVNALAYDHPAALWNIISHVSTPLTAQDLAAFEQVPWGQAGSHIPVAPFRIAIASYPPLYYWTAFALAQPVTRLLSLSPYDAIWAYRFATGFVVALLWVAVFVELRRLPETRALAPALLAFLLLNPMVGYLSGAVHTDGASIALGTLALLLAWRTLRTGEAARMTLLVLLAGLLAKPAGVTLAGSIAVAAVLTGLAGRARRQDTVRLLLIVALAGALAYAAFYAWSPPVVFGEPAHVPPYRYLRDFDERVAWLWTGAWGLLGWVDVSLPAWWYNTLALLLLASAGCALWRPWPTTSSDPAGDSAAGSSTSTSLGNGLFPAGSTSARGSGSGFGLFFVAAGIAFGLATLAGEQQYTRVAGYFIQGRYFLPVLAALLPLLRHRVPLMRGALLLYLFVFSLLLMRLNVLRCYGDWHTFWLSLPFVS